MKTAQRSLKSFVLYNENEEECAAFLRRYHAVIKDYLLVFTQSISTEIERLLDSLDLRLYVSLKQSSSILHRFAQDSRQDVLDSSDLGVLDSKKDEFLRLNRTIRSGQEIECQTSLIINGNINDGASIFVKKDLIVLGDNHGRIDCSGKVLMLRKTIKPVIFRGQILDFGDLSEQSEALKFICEQDGQTEILEFKG